VPLFCLLFGTFKQKIKNLKNLQKSFKNPLTTDKNYCIIDKPIIVRAE
jgi:hypothetical protein